MDGIEKIEGFLAKVGVTYRVLINYMKERRLLLHLQVARDASLYLFEDQPQKVYYGKATIEQGKTSEMVDITQGNILDNTLKGEHFSFHGSGVINNPTGRAIGHPLRKLDETAQIYTIIFPHLSKVPEIIKLRNQI